MKTHCTRGRLWHRWSAWTKPRAEQSHGLFGGTVVTVRQARQCLRCKLAQVRDLSGWPTRKIGDRWVALPLDEAIRVPDSMPEEIK